MHDATSAGPLFIVGAQRSGTTLLRLLLNAHPQLAIPEEARFLVPLLEWRFTRQGLSGKTLQHALRYLRENEQLRRWNYDPAPYFDSLDGRDHVTLHDLIDGLYASYATSEGKPRWGDKSLFFRHVELLHAVFPGARFVHIVRDGRDVFRSWRRMDPTKSNPAVIGLDWSYKVRAIDRALRRVPDECGCTITYENMLRSPARVLAAVCTFLGLEYDGAMLEFHKSSKYYIGKHHSDLIFSPIDARNVDRWKQELTADEVALFTATGSGRLREFGYDTDRVGAGTMARAALALVAGLPERIAQIRRTQSAMHNALATGTQAELDIGDMPVEKKPPG